MAGKFPSASSRITRLLTALALALQCSLAAAAEPQDAYAAFHTSTYLPFLGAAGPRMTESPHLRLSFGAAARDAVMDTGSTGIVVSADAIPDLAALPSTGPARLTYSSSGRIMEGRWVTTPVTIAGADGASVTTAPIPVLAVERIACLRTARRCTPRERPQHVSMIGIGFGREYDHQPDGTPDHNPFLNLAAAPGLRRGYVVTRTGVHVGLTAADTAGGFAFARLVRDARWPDWAQAQACITIATTAPACGRLLVDTGVSAMYLTVPPDRLSDGGLPSGASVAIQLIAGDQPLGYSFTVGDPANPLAPEGVTLSGIGKRATFVNTSFHLLNGFDYLYDADGGWVGFRPVR